MAEFRKAYIEVREIIADELKEKYNLVESYRESDRLTLNNSNYSLHLTFYTPEGVDVDITNHKEEYYNDSFMGLVVKKYPNVNEMGKKLKSLFNTRSHFDSGFSYIYSSLSNKIKFIEEEYSELFKI